MINLSCGHMVSDIDHSYDVITKSTGREGEKALMYSVVCGPCEDGYRIVGHLFDTEKQAMVWLAEEKW